MSNGILYKRERDQYILAAKELGYIQNMPELLPLLENAKTIKEAEVLLSRARGTEKKATIPEYAIEMHTFDPKRYYQVLRIQRGYYLYSPFHLLKSSIPSELISFDLKGKGTLLGVRPLRTNTFGEISLVIPFNKLLDNAEMMNYELYQKYCLKTGAIYKLTGILSRIAGKKKISTTAHKVATSLEQLDVDIYDVDYDESTEKATFTFRCMSDIKSDDITILTRRSFKDNGFVFEPEPVLEETIC